MAFQALLAITLGLVAILRWALTRRKGAYLPPGPRGKPIIGNLLDFPAPGEQEWQHWLKHKDIYGIIYPDSNAVIPKRLGDEKSTLSTLTGPLSSVTVFGSTMIIINDRDLAFQILEKNSAKHSSRPHLPFANDLYVFAEYSSFRVSLRRSNPLQPSILGPAGAKYRQAKAIRLFSVLTAEQ
jgi:hypothetical protein